MVIITIQFDGNYYHQTFSHEIGQLLFEKTMFSISMKQKNLPWKNDTLAIVVNVKPEP